MVRAVAFDFDGVLVESVDVKTRAFARLFEPEGPEAVARIVDYHLRHGGVPRFDKFRTIYRDILRRPLPDAEFDRLCRTFAGYVVEAVVAAPWVAGAQEFLARQQGRYRFFIISGTPEGELRMIVERRGMARWFEEVLGSPATKEQLLEGLLARHRLQPGDVACVGDSSTDWAAAQRLRLPFVWRRSGEETPIPDDFRGPCITDLTELDGWLAALETCGTSAAFGVRG
ncbi:MAG: HAD family hydrolase [Candidatus Omnitrophica bacterium]|nr:HAD family hydrolase [Candidatus Omnitrophota bacterium]